MFSLEIVERVSNKVLRAWLSPARDCLDNWRTFSIKVRMSSPCASLMVSPRKRPNILILWRRVRYSSVI